LALVHLGSALPGRRVVIVDGRLDPDPERTVAALAPEALCLGVTVLTGAPILDARQVSAAARAVWPHLPVVWGGWHPSLLPGQCPGSGVVAARARGRGGGGPWRAVPGLTWRDGDRIVRNRPRPFEDLNRFPAADFGLVDL